MAMIIDGDGRGKLAKLPEPQEVPSGYLKYSAVPKSGDICHAGQRFRPEMSFNIS